MTKTELLETRLSEISQITRRGSIRFTIAERPDEPMIASFAKYSVCVDLEDKHWVFGVRLMLIEKVLEDLQQELKEYEITSAKAPERALRKVTIRDEC